MSISRSRLTSRGRATAALGALTVTLGLLAGGTAHAAPSPTGRIPLGDGYLGVTMHRTQTASTSASVSPMAGTDGVQGVDVSHYQGTINWTSVRNAGIQFAWIKATEGTSYKDPAFNTNYLNAYNAGVIRGAYHFARPDVSGGATQANYFASNGGAWSKDNLTLPGVLDIEGDCYGLSQSSMRSWILDFYNTYKSRTTRDIVIYTSPSWWSTCTGGWTGMASRSPLWVAHWTTAASPTVPTGFSAWTVWQYSSTGSVSGVSGNVDRDKFNGSRDRLLALANNTP
ncbi:GH25 family lysozyme [Streptacidiphilus griseoplanus]|uniref:GH25 family lysozyme n=1 Tax=Peterkaempfera griseoplana TaxID=66896 RepID=UPI000A99B440|nr:GH25 family lysozyme [Peterkaempfera griseoplana]